MKTHCLAALCAAAMLIACGPQPSEPTQPLPTPPPAPSATATGTPNAMPTPEIRGEPMATPATSDKALVVPPSEMPAPGGATPAP